MNRIKSITFLMLLLAAFTLKAQGGNFVVSEVKLYDMGNGTAVLAVRVSGSGAQQVTEGTFTVTGEQVPGGTYSGGIGDNTRVIITAPTPGQGNGAGNVNPNGNDPVILTGVIPILPKTTPGPPKYDFWGSVKSERVFYHWSTTVSTSNP